MGGADFQEEAVLAAVKPLTTAEFTGSEAKNIPGPDHNSTIKALDRQNPLETLFRQQSNRVFRTAYRVTGSAADAEDVLQTVFLRLARDPESLIMPEDPEGYFARAAINASLDLLRSRKRSRSVAFDDVEISVGVAFRQNPEAGHEDRELRNLIRAAVSRLAPTAAQMFTLRYFEGYDNGEIAGIMKTSALVVGVTLHRARARLRKEIGQYLRKD